ncbi:hypothetical protein EK0264_12090 [Epidermidibacterium keratini]|uniref:Uncharacterized protein n=1 Tax=Epidermidibacterium keratini TaxID=1891644 RepID=A0A7L4YPW9_9ACTN|nr:hypothetical protein [Epidermidibacterium keratini]QHC00953.1 hypothetical protein EK0264_12090 [Epidermidibacterium keratini]
MLTATGPDRPVSRAAVWASFAAIAATIMAFTIALFADFTVGGKGRDWFGGGAWENPRIIQESAGNQLAGIVLSLVVMCILLATLLALDRKRTTHRLLLVICALSWAAGIMFDALIRKRPGGPETESGEYGPAAIAFVLAVGSALVAIVICVFAFDSGKPVDRAGTRPLHNLVGIFCVAVGVAWFVPIYHLSGGDDLGSSKINMLMNESGSGHDEDFAPVTISRTIVGTTYLAEITLVLVAALVYLLIASTRRSVAMAVGVIGAVAGIMISQANEALYFYALRQSTGLEFGGAVFVWLGVWVASLMAIVLRAWLRRPG